MEPGRLRHRIQIQSVTETRDASGGVIPIWETDAVRWAAIEPLKGRERYDADMVQSDVTHKITIRYYADLNSKQRFKFNDRLFEIMEPPINDREINKMQVVMCKEQL